MIKRIKKVYSKFDSWMDWNPPGALTAKGWRLFKEEFKEKAPIRYWLKNDFRHKVTLPICWKFRAVNDWIRYRTCYRYHVVKTGLQPDYYDFETRMLHANFNMFKDFIECEKAQRDWMWSDERKANERWYERLPMYWKFVEFRRPEHGLKHLEWEATLDDPSLPPHEQSPAQAVSAREQLALYKWWVETRPARKEETLTDYDDQGLGIMGVFDDDFDRDAEDYKRHHDIFERNQLLHEEWKKEDEEMLIRLIKIRSELWT